MVAGEARIGISGWRYAGWRGRFYPKGLAQRLELSYAAKKFSSIEINGTHYSLQRPESFRLWRDETPENFVFAVKGSRYITHMLQLKNVETALANFFAQGILALGAKLGPVLWQIPRRFHFHPEKLTAFFRALPRDHAAAARLARKHDERLAGRASTTAEAQGCIRHALEVRHESFLVPDFVDLLRMHHIGLVVSDGAGWPLLLDTTADFVYVRLHGSRKLYASGYRPSEIALWADRTEHWMRGRAMKGERCIKSLGSDRIKRDVYVYFDNDAKVRAPFDALALEKALRNL
jgi:uncharacterized protein YecE (DUF72 family)